MQIDKIQIDNPTIFVYNIIPYFSIYTEVCHVLVVSGKSVHIKGYFFRQRGTGKNNIITPGNSPTRTHAQIQIDKG